MLVTPLLSQDKMGCLLSRPPGGEDVDQGMHDRPPAAGQAAGSEQARIVLRPGGGGHGARPLGMYVHDTSAGDRLHCTALLRYCTTSTEHNIAVPCRGGAGRPWPRRRWGGGGLESSSLTLT